MQVYSVGFFGPCRTSAKQAKALLPKTTAEPTKYTVAKPTDGGSAIESVYVKLSVVESMYNDLNKADENLKVFMRDTMKVVDVSSVQDGQVFMVEFGIVFGPVQIPIGMIVEIIFELQV